MVFPGKYKYGSESNDEDILEEELVVTYRFIYVKWEEACMVGEKQNKTISSFI